MNMLGSLVVSMVAVAVASYILPGVEVTGLVPLLVAVILMGVVNTFLRPVLTLLTLPITLLTLGLFSFVINALLVLLVSALVPGFEVTGFVPALLFSLVVSLVSSVLNKVID